MKVKVRPKKVQSQLNDFFTTQRSSSSAPVKRKVKQEPSGGQNKQKEKIEPESSSKKFKANDQHPEIPKKATSISKTPGTPKKATSTKKNDRIWLSKLEYAEINDTIKEKIESLNKEIDASSKEIRFWKEERERCMLLKEKEKFLRDQEELQTQFEEDYKQRTPKRFQINHLEKRKFKHKGVNEVNKNSLLSQDLFSDSPLDCSMEDLDELLDGTDTNETNNNQRNTFQSHVSDYAAEEGSDLVWDEPFETDFDKTNKNKSSANSGLKNHILDYSLEELSVLVSTPFESKKKELAEHAESSKQQFLMKETREHLGKKRSLEEALMKAKVEVVGARREYEEFVRDNNT